jgi:hypothetical protein
MREKYLDAQIKETNNKGIPNINFKLIKKKIIEKEKKKLLKYNDKRVNLSTVMLSPHMKELNRFNSLTSKELLSQVHNLFATGVSITTICQTKIEFEKETELKKQKIQFCKIDHDKGKVWNHKIKKWKKKYEALISKLQKINNKKRIEVIKSKNKELDLIKKYDDKRKESQNIKNKLTDIEINFNKIKEKIIGSEEKHNLIKNKMFELKKNNVRLKMYCEQSLFDKQTMETEMVIQIMKLKELNIKHVELNDKHEKLQKNYNELCASVESFSHSLTVSVKKQRGVNIYTNDII